MPIGKKKTALIDANRKKKKTALIDANRKKPTLENSFQRNLAIKRFGFPNDATDCILRI